MHSYPGSRHLLDAPASFSPHLLLSRLFCVFPTLRSTFQRAYAAFESSPSRSRSLNVIHFHHHLQCFRSRRVRRQRVRARAGSISHSSPFMWSWPLAYARSHSAFLSLLPTFLLPASLLLHLCRRSDKICFGSLSAAKGEWGGEKKNPFSVNFPFFTSSCTTLLSLPLLVRWLISLQDLIAMLP